MARKSWSSLDPTYRRRLERKGIDRQGYESEVSLQEARGQKIEKERIEARKLNPSIPGTSTVRAWKRRALASKVSRSDWDSAIESQGLDNFDEVKKVILAKEQAHRTWRSQGSPSSKTRKALRASNEYEYYDYDAPDEWGDSWGYYH